jgi:hypothetical protein
MSSQSIDCFLWHGSRNKHPHRLVEVMQMMKCNHIDMSHSSGALFRRWWWKAALAVSLLIAGPAAAANVPKASVNKFALNAYCSEAHHKAASLADGSISYKQVADLASERALAEHPNVYPDTAPWKTKIVALLDQYGDEPMSEFCSENPGPRS